MDSLIVYTTYRCDSTIYYAYITTKQLKHFEKVVTQTSSNLDVFTFKPSKEDYGCHNRLSVQAIGKTLKKVEEARSIRNVPRSREDYNLIN